MSKSKWDNCSADGTRLPRGIRIANTRSGRRYYVRTMVEGKQRDIPTDFYEHDKDGLKLAVARWTAIKHKLIAAPPAKGLPAYSASAEVGSLLAGYFRWWHGSDDPTPSAGKREKKAIQTFQAAAKNLVQFFGYDRDAHTIRTEDLEAYVKARGKMTLRGAAPTVRSILRELAIFKAAIVEGRNTRCIQPGFEIRWPRQSDFPEAKNQPVDPRFKAHVRRTDEIKHFIVNLPSWVQEIFRFSVQTGFRAAEVERITRQGYDRETGTVTIRFKRGGIKTRTLSPRARAIIESVIERRGFENYPTALLFVFNRDTNDKSQNTSPYGYASAVQRANDLLGLKGRARIKLRDMRATAVRRAYDGLSGAAKDIEAARELAGHTTYQQTKTYIGVGNESKTNSVLDSYDD